MKRRDISHVNKEAAMCYGWYEERLLAEQQRLAKQKLDELKRLEGTTQAPGRKPAPEPERRKDTQPDPVPV
jgi:hypothetical protein